MSLKTWFTKKRFATGHNAQNERHAPMAYDQINEWWQRLLDRQVHHLQPGDILLKMNFTLDKVPVANIISTGQRILQVSEKEGDWATGHVAIAIDQLRVAEQTGAGVSINTLGVTEKSVAEHKVDTVYYYVWRCRKTKIAETAAKLANSFATARPLRNSREQLYAGIGGQYALGTALASVFKPKGSSLAQTVNKHGDLVKLDPWSQNIYDYCCGATPFRKDMYCSAFVLAVYQAACHWEANFGNEQLTAAKLCLMPLVPKNTTPRTYQAHLRGSSQYSEIGVFRYVDLPELNRAKLAASRVFANLSQAIDNYANFITTGNFGASGDKTLQEHIESLVKARMNDIQRIAEARGRPKSTKFSRFFKPVKDKFNDPTEKTDRKVAIQQLVTQRENADYHRLSQMRDAIMNDGTLTREGLEDFFILSAEQFQEACKEQVRNNVTWGILELFIANSLKATHGIHEQRNAVSNQISEPRLRNRSGANNGAMGRLDDSLVAQALAGNFD